MAHSIGKTIAELRKAKGWTQVELAEKLGVSDKAVSKWESEGGFPEITQLPVLASIFGVSIDYLMTGKTPEKSVLIISKLELCAKNDDVELFNSLPENVLLGKDENGKSILDYALTYSSKNIVKLLFEKHPAKNILEAKKNASRYVGSYGSRPNYSNWGENILVELLVRNNLISELESIGAFNSIFESTSPHSDAYRRGIKLQRPAINNYLYRDNMRSIILNDDEISNELRVAFYKTLSAIEILDAMESYINSGKSELLSLICSVVFEINKISANEKEKKEREISSLTRKKDTVKFVDYPCDEKKLKDSQFYTYEYQYFVIVFPVSLIKKLLDAGYYEFANQANEFNIQIRHPALEEEQFAYARALKSGTSTDDLRLLKVLRHGIVKIDDLLATKDIEFVTQVLNKYPVHIIEKKYIYLKNIEDMVSKGEWRALFQKAVDENLEIVSGIVHQNVEKIRKWISDQFVALTGKSKGYGGYGYKKVVFFETFFVEDQEYIEENAKYFEVAERNHNLVAGCDYKKAIDYIKECKKRILENLPLQLDKERTISGLTKEYFEFELSKGNFDTVIIKLCIRLESILKNDFKYEGTFAEMIDKYCNEKLHWTGDDGWGYPTCECDSKTINALNKLRMKRNNIVHAEQNPVELTIDDIRYCIEYICKMG